MAPVTYAIDQLIDLKFCVKVENEDQWKELKAVKETVMTNDYYGPKYYYLSEGSWSTTNLRGNTPISIVVNFDQIIFPPKQKIIGRIAPMDMFGINIKAGTVYKKTSSKPTPTPMYGPVDKNNNSIGGFSYNLPAELVETWKPFYAIEDYKVGQWVLIRGDNNGNGLGEDGVYRLMQIDLKRNSTGHLAENSHFMFYTKNGNYLMTSKDYIVRQASSQEILIAATLQAELDGFLPGVGLEYAGIIGSINKGKIKNFFLDNYPGMANEPVLWVIFENGETHTIYNYYNDVQWKVIKYPAMNINSYDAEFKEMHVKFGCAEIHKNLFIHLSQYITDSPTDGNCHVEGVKIGKGYFTMEQIDEIAEYYLNQ